MRDRDAVALAVAAWIGAIAATPIPRLAGVAVVLAGLAVRRPLVLLVGVVLLACALGHSARGGLVPIPAASFAGEVELVRDPVRVRGGIRVDVRADGRRYEATAHGAAARQLQRRAAGDRILVEGRIAGRPAVAPWLDARHIVARLDIRTIGEWAPGSVAARAANATRRILARGATALPRDQRPLYTGMVFGDDRGQPATVVDDLRAAGLGHLLAVSGQNVAVVLGAAGPLLERYRYRVRFPATLALLGAVLLVTRAEPSILRAVAMSGVVALAAALGRSTSSLRVLALAVTALVLVDPLLVEAVGFQLSVAASAGIVLMAGPIAASLPGPAALANTVGVTLAAQLAVAPIALGAFGGVPVAAIPANVIAAPVAGPLMVWGLTAGVVAGFVGGPVAALIHLPTRLMLGWVQVVGAIAGRVPLGELRVMHLVALGPSTAVVLATRHRPRGVPAWVRRGAIVAVAVTLVAPAVQLRTARADGELVTRGVQVWHAGSHSVVVLDGRADPVDALEALRRSGVRRIDVIVARTGGVMVGDVVRALEHRYGIGVVWAPVAHQIRGAVVPVVGSRVRAGRFTVDVTSVDPRLDVRVSRAG